MDHFLYRTIVLSLTALLVMVFTQATSHSVQAVQNAGKYEIPQAICIYNEKKYYLTPHMYNNGYESIRIDYPDLPDDHPPKMIIEKGNTLTMEFAKEPTRVDALLVDYDSDVTETYPLKKIGDNKFQITEPGIKNLEVIGTFPNNQRVSYTTLINVEDK